MLKRKIQEDQVTSLKSGNSDRLEVLRYILAQVKNKEIEKKSELDDQEIVAVLAKIKRELNEAIVQFEKGGRGDLVQNNKRQLEIIEEYLPAEMSEAELKGEIEKIIAQNQELIAANPKAILGVAIRELKGRADSSRIVAIINSREK
jgi:uncharacterized protein YqeY